MPPIKLERITGPKGHNGTKIFWQPILVEVDGRVITHDLVYLKGGNTTQGFTDAVIDIGSPACNRVWSLDGNVVKQIRKRVQTERLNDDERQGLYREAVEKIADEIEAALTSGELPDANAAMLRAAEAAEISPYASGLAGDTLRYSGFGRTMRGLAQRILVRDVLEMLMSRPVFVDAKKSHG